MTPDGRINENGGKFEGLTMEEARAAVVEKLKNLGLLEKVETYKQPRRRLLPVKSCDRAVSVQTVVRQDVRL